MINRKIRRTGFQPQNYIKQTKRKEGGGGNGTENINENEKMFFIGGKTLRTKQKSLQQLVLEQSGQ